MKKIIPLAIILLSCGNQKQENSVQRTIKSQTDTWDGGRLYDLNCMTCHRNPKTVNLNKLDTLTFEHRNMKFTHIDSISKSKIRSFIGTLKK